jgi:hypothetical protein
LDFNILDFNILDFKSLHPFSVVELPLNAWCKTLASCQRKREKINLLDHN